ncbi:MAG TPA: radical SAM protein [Candidatus Binatia bacterium]|nr:radical SAM protein [Candidatus Binatia bacterium]
MRVDAEIAELPSEGSHQLSELPILLLNVHENCNCRCVMCDIWKRPQGSEIATADLTRHRESIRFLKVRQVVLTGGEPLLHSNLEALCEILRSCGVTITLLTTGLLLSKRADIVTRWIDEVIVSLDGPEHVHNEIRRVDRGYQLIREGIAAVRRLAPRMPIRARSTVQRSNFAFLRDTVAAARQLGFDSISFLAADVSSSAFNRELVWPIERQNQIAVAPAEIHTLEQEVEQLVEQYGDETGGRFILESPEKLRRIVRRFREYTGELLPESPICDAPWVSAVLEVDGSVRPCFFHRTVGNVSAHSLAGAINSEAAQQFRKTLNVANNPVCQRCVCSLHYNKGRDAK